MIFQHPGQALGTPGLIQLTSALFAVRFETMKVLSARGAVQRLLEDGTVRKGGTVIDSSSGIYAHALALACHEFGLNCRIVGSTSIDAVLKVQLELLGAELEQMPATTDLALDQGRRVVRIRQLLEANPDFHWMGQYHDPIHLEGYKHLATDVAMQLRSAGIDAVTLCAPVGSGVSSRAFAEAFLAAGLPLRLVGVQPFGSMTFGAQDVPDPQMLIAGIGSSIPFRNVRHTMYDAVHWVSFDVAGAAAITLLRRHALFAGLSTGAAFAAADWEHRTAPAAAGEAVIVLCPDTGNRYVGNVFARHQEFESLGNFQPAAVNNLAELRLPWSAMEWCRAEDPAGGS